MSVRLRQDLECCDNMGKRIISRARGKGGPPYRSPGHRFARDTPLAKILTKDKKEKLVVAAEGIKVGDKLTIGSGVRIGNVLKLFQMPKGSYVFGIETVPGSGPKFCLSSGTRAIVVSIEPGKVILQMPSKAFKNFHPNCLATYGIPAGAGRADKPFVKAGQKHFAMHARNKLWPRSSASAMNAVDHPFGGSAKPGKSKSISRHAPPGAKVGSIASKRTGKRK